jgi:hypothetical protein
MPDKSFAAVSLKIKIPETADQAQTTASTHNFEQLGSIINHCITCMNYLIEFRQNDAAPSLPRHRAARPDRR